VWEFDDTLEFTCDGKGGKGNSDTLPSQDVVSGSDRNLTAVASLTEDGHPAIRAGAHTYQFNDYAICLICLLTTLWTGNEFLKGRVSTS